MILSIQYLRGLAASSVVLFHTSEMAQLPFAVGAAGVDLFFVISGFVMWATMLDRPMSPWRFAWRRFTRIVPLYWIVTAVTAAAVILKPQFFPGQDVTLQTLVGSLFFLPPVTGAGLSPIVLQGWTLSYEILFYLIFAATLVLPVWQRLRMVLAVLLSLMLVHPWLPEGLPRALTEPLLAEFGIGVLIAALWSSGLRIPFALCLVILAAGVAGLVASQVVADDLPRWLRWGLPAAAVLAGAVFAERARPHRPLRALTWLGDASYSLYLWHVVAGVVAVGLAGRLGLPDPWLPLAMLVGGTLAALALYELVERPLLRLLHPRVTAKPPGVAHAPSGALA
ncbi:acyltransferase family protein [Rhodobacter sp. NSM]|uniref:acyltransferase family protein n=1 Tax=Rhodobacter sp. NSM TaxID=3457501 RepID=UPI003FD558FD